MARLYAFHGETFKLALARGSFLLLFHIDNGGAAGSIYLRFLLSGAAFIKDSCLMAFLFQ